MNIGQVILDGFIAALTGVCATLLILVVFAFAVIQFLRNKTKGTVIETMVANLLHGEKKP